MSINNQICESFSWLQDAKDIIMETSDPKAVRLKVKFARANEVSKNGRKYLDEELSKGTRTMIGKRVNLNHDNKVITGRIPWAEYENGVGEAVVEITKEPYVTMLKNHSTKVQGVSIQANYLKCQCSKCGKKFDTETAIQEHLRTVEYLKDAANVPRGLIFSDPAMALVLSPETPGCDTNIEIMETAGHGWMSLVETVLTERVGVEAAKQEHEYMLHSHEVNNTMDKIKAPISFQTREKYVYESESPPPPEMCPECGKPLNVKGECTTKGCSKNTVKEASMCKECGKPLKEGECWNRECKEYAGPKQAKEVMKCPNCGEPLINNQCTNPNCSQPEAAPVKEIKIPKITVTTDAKPSAKTVLKESALTPITLQPIAIVPYETVLKETHDEVETAQKIKQTRQITESIATLTDKLNTVIFEVNKPVIADIDDLRWREHLQTLQTQINGAFTQLTESLPKDDLSWQHKILNLEATQQAALAKANLDFTAANAATKKMVEEIKPYDDKPIIEKLLAIEKSHFVTTENFTNTINTLPKDDITWATKLTALEAADIQLNDLCTKQAGQITELSNTHKTAIAEIKAIVETQKQDFETLLAVADRNIEETKKSLEQRITELKTQNEAKETELNQVKETLDKTRTITENLQDKQKGQFQGHNRKIASENNEPIRDDPTRTKEKK